jgi:hypothetical protein
VAEEKREGLSSLEEALLEMTDQPFLFASRRLYIDGGNLSSAATRKAVMARYSHLLEVEQLGLLGTRPTCLTSIFKDEAQSVQVDGSTEECLRDLLEAVDGICLDESLSEEITGPLERVFQGLRVDFDNESRYRQLQAQRNSQEGRPESKGLSSLRKTSRFQFQPGGTASLYSARKDNRMVGPAHPDPRAQLQRLPGRAQVPLQAARVRPRVHRAQEHEQEVRVHPR